jgi:formylglycine-generating enzyme required for sulfatase activity
MPARIDRPAALSFARPVIALIAATAALLFASTARAQGACGADINRDGVVGPADLSQLLGAWGSCSNCTADTNLDGAVNAADLTVVLANWGASCAPLSWATTLEYSPNPAVVTSAAMRQAIAATGKPWRVRTNASPQIEMLLVPPGTFQMGCSSSIQTDCAADELPVHAVTLTSAFYLGRYEVTQAQWLAVVGLNPSYFQAPNYPNSGNRPVERLSQIQAVSFAASSGLRLPTEAEWEYAYRGGTTTAYHSTPRAPMGSDDQNAVVNIGWIDANSSGQTHIVGGLAPNALGFHDMSGNVYEWCSDWYGPYSASPQTNPTGGSSASGERVARGGSYNLPPYYAGASKRIKFLPNYQFSPIIGVRVARNP